MLETSALLLRHPAKIGLVKRAIVVLALVDVVFFVLFDFLKPILAHEYLVDEYRLGDVVIGDEVMISANSTILPGVVIGDRAVVAAGTVVHKDVPPGAMAAGDPMRIVRRNEPPSD